MISENVVVGNGCTIGMGARVPINQKIADNSILYGPQLLTHNSPESSLVLFYFFILFNILFIRF